MCVICKGSGLGDILDNKRGKVSYLKSLFTTQRSQRYDFRNLVRFHKKTKVECNLLIKMSWSIVSKAALRSKSAIIEIFLSYAEEGFCKF